MFISSSNPQTTKSQRLLRILIPFTILIIWVHSAMPASISSEESGWVYELILPLAKLVHLEDFWEIYVRKVAHFTEYFVLGALMSAHALISFYRRAKAGLFVLVAGAAVAVVDENIQRFAEGRSCQLSDALLDCCGVLTAFVVVLVVCAVVNLRKGQD